MARSGFEEIFNNNVLYCEFYSLCDNNEISRTYVIHYTTRLFYVYFKFSE